MFAFFVLGGWMLSGLATAIALRIPGEPRYGWTLFAIVLGPLWFAIAAERRSTDRPAAVLTDSGRMDIPE